MSLFNFKENKSQFLWSLIAFPIGPFFFGFMNPIFILSTLYAGCGRNAFELDSDIANMLLHIFISWIILYSLLFLLKGQTRYKRGGYLFAYYLLMFCGVFFVSMAGMAC